MKSIWTIARRELKSLFDQPTGYILLIVFVAINDFLFFRQAYLYGVASLRPMLELLPWVFFFFVPAVTMRALSEDVRTGTIEIVLAQPLTELQLLLGKYLGQLLFVWIALALTLPVPIGLSVGADMHTGVVFAQYTGAALLGAGFTAVGVWTSTLTRHQMTAFIIGVAVMFVLVLVGLDPLLVGLPPTLGAVAARLGVLSHFRDIARGVIDLRDAVYFITLTAIFLSLAYSALMSRKLTPRGDVLKRLRMGTALIVVGLIVVNLFGRHIRGRLDLTPGNSYTLSRATRDIVRDLGDIVTIKLFVSEELPPEVAMLQRDLDDLLRDYRTAGDGNVRVVVQDPGADTDVAEEARSLGIPPVQFNVMGESELTVREGYMGLAVQYADQTETIPFVQRTEDLEYRLTSYIRGMTSDESKTVGIYVAPQDQQIPGRTANEFRNALQQTYDVRSVALPGDSQPSADIDVLVLVGSPDSLPADQIARLRAFFDRGGAAIITADGMNLTTQSEFALPRNVVWNQVLEPYGVSVQSNMAYDLLANERVTLPTQFGQMLLSYPFWLRAVSTRSVAMNGDIESVLMPWASVIDTATATPGTVTPLFVTSQGAGVEEDMAMLNPRREFSQDDLGVRLLAVMVNPAAADSAEAGPRGRIVLAGTTTLFGDGYARGNPGNLAFGLNAVDWLAQDEALVQIRAKNRTPPPLVFSSEGKRDLVKHANVVGVPLLLAIFAAFRLVNRRKQMRQTYQPRVVQGAPA